MTALLSSRFAFRFPRSGFPSLLWLLAPLLLSTTLLSPATVAADPESAQELFDRRIMPIFRSPKPSSCVQCHLSSVDLRRYILPSQEKTFASLRDQGLVNLDAPAESKILKLIQMGEKDADPGARLIHEKTRRAEYEAFAAWIKACCADSRLRELPATSAKVGPERPVEVIRHARKSRVVDSFVRNIWSQRMRCFPCHTPHEIDADNPRHQAPQKTMRQFKERLDDSVFQRLAIFKKTPEATLDYLVKQSRAKRKGALPLLNLADPADSLLVLKPTSKLPKKNEDGTFEPASSVAPVSHMGGLKMHRDDQSYKSFIAWIQDYAKVVGDRYVATADLPADNWHGSQLVLRVTEAPESWKVGTPVQMFVYGWDESKEKWTAEPLGFTQGTVTPRRIVNGALFLFGRANALPGDSSPSKLDRGRYLVKVHVDRDGVLAKDPARLLGKTEFAGQVELPRARWREGFRRAEVVSAAKLKR